MKVMMVGDVEFEAESTDEALLKLAVHFLGQMSGKTRLMLKGPPPIDAIEIMIESLPHLDEVSTEGYINVEFLGNHAAPEMLQ